MQKVRYKKLKIHFCLHTRFEVELVEAISRAVNGWSCFLSSNYIFNIELNISEIEEKINGENILQNTFKDHLGASC